MLCGSRACIASLYTRRSHIRIVCHSSCDTPRRTTQTQCIAIPTSQGTLSPFIGRELYGHDPFTPLQESEPSSSPAGRPGSRCDAIYLASHAPLRELER